MLETAGIKKYNKNNKIGKMCRAGTLFANSGRRYGATGQAVTNEWMSIARHKPPEDQTA